MKTTYNELVSQGRKIFTVHPVNGSVQDHWTADLVGYASIDTDEVIATTAGGEKVHVARDGERHIRIVIR